MRLQDCSSGEGYYVPFSQPPAVTDGPGTANLCANSNLPLCRVAGLLPKFQLMLNAAAIRFESLKNILKTEQSKARLAVTLDCAPSREINSSSWNPAR
jgi:hypothetical protein